MSSAEATTKVPPSAACDLRRRVRALAEEEYLRLRGADRPALLRRGVGDAVAIDVLTAELEILDERLADLDRFLHRTTGDLAAVGCVVLLDAGDGPEYVLVADLALPDDQVVAADSPLGVALRDAVPGDTVTAATPRGPREARVMATERGVPAGGWSTIPPAGRVVVGLHDSEHATDALAVGFAEASRRQAHLDVTVVRDAHGTPGGDGLEPAFHAADEEDRAEAVHLPAVVAAIGRAYPAVPVSTSVRTGHFASVLTEMSRSADLVVLGMGDRPQGMGRKELFVAGHARCPVIVVRESPSRGGS